MFVLLNKKKNMEIDSNNNNKTLVKTARNTHKCRDKIATGADLTLETLNMECFLMIVDHLDSQSLMDLCDVNEQFEANICAYEHIFKSKLFEVDEFIDVSFHSVLHFFAGTCRHY